MSNAVDTAMISNTLGKMAHYLATHNSICVSVSGGGDSTIIVHMIATYFREYLDKIHFVFCDTGMEYAATRRFLNEMGETYNITIENIRGIPIPLAVKKYGVPVLSKAFSDIADAYSRDVPYGMYRVDHPDKCHGLQHLSDTNVAMAKAIKERGINVSNKCCSVSKKKPFAIYYKDHDIDLNITGERRAEGGLRAAVYDSCFQSNKKGPDKYMPLYFWSDELKAYYKDAEKIRYSDCYEVWGLKRTGCVGCPCNSRVSRELEIIRKYEPKMYKACVSVFGESYALMDEFCVRRKNKILEHQK